MTGRRPDAPRERGSILVLALVVSAAGTIAGMQSILTSDLCVRANRYLVRAADAARIAMSGLQEARVRLGENPGFTGATIADPADPSESVTIVATAIGTLRANVAAIGTAGDATQQVIASLRAVAHPALNYNVVSATTVLFDDATLNGYVRANGAVTAAGSVDFAGTLEVVDGASVTNQIAAVQVIETSAALPPPTVSIASFVSLSTPIAGAPFDAARQAWVLEKLALRPDRNPHGNANARGAYVLDAHGKDVILRDVYVEGCLTIVDVGKVWIEQGYHHVRADLALPTLVVDGSLQMRPDDFLSELLLTLDFNGDGDLFDVYLPAVEGIVYVADEFIGPYGADVIGCVIANSVTLAGSSEFANSGALSAQPVLQFTVAGPWDVLPGSIAQG